LKVLVYVAVGLGLLALIYYATAPTVATTAVTGDGTSPGAPPGNPPAPTTAVTWHGQTQFNPGTIRGTPPPAIMPPAGVKTPSGTAPTWGGHPVATPNIIIASPGSSQTGLQVGSSLLKVPVKSLRYYQ
jgi:hypothetical protein